MLSAVKHLRALRDRSFASLRMTNGDDIRLARARKQGTVSVMESTAKHLYAHRGRSFASLRMTSGGVLTGDKWGVLTGEQVICGGAAVRSIASLRYHLLLLLLTDFVEKVNFNPCLSIKSWNRP